MRTTSHDDGEESADGSVNEEPRGPRQNLNALHIGGPPTSELAPGFPASLEQ